MAISITRAIIPRLSCAVRVTDRDGPRHAGCCSALVLEGRSRTEAARSCGMDRQTLRDWVHRYNAEGLAGLLDRQRSGDPRV